MSINDMIITEKMRRQLLMLLGALLSLLPFAAKAQTFDALWAQFDAAYQKDLPASARDVLFEIRKKAAHERADAQLLRALVTECAVAREISPDSGNVVLQQIERAMAQEHRPVERALWLSAYGQLTGNADSLLASIAQPEVLADARTADYATLFEMGEDSRWTHDDLLALLTRVVLDREGYRGISKAQAQDARSRMRRVYEQKGYEEALLMMEYDEMVQKQLSDDEKGGFIAKIRSMLPRFKGSHAQKVLSAYIAGEESGYIRASFEASESLFYPGKSYAVSVDTRNVSHAELRIYRLKKAAGSDLMPDAMDDADLTRLCKRAGLTLCSTHRVPAHDAPAHVGHTDTLQIQFDAPGLYRVELRENGKIRDFTVVPCTRICPVLFSYDEGGDYRLRLMLVDARDGEPFRAGVAVQSAKIQHYGWGRRAEERQAVHWNAAAGIVGGICWLDDADEQLLVSAQVGDDVFLPPFYATVGQGFHPVQQKVTSGRMFTDRAVYRPGQTVHFGGVVYQQQQDDVQSVQGWNGKVVLLDPQRKTLSDTTVCTSDMGDFNGSFVLPEPLMPGLYQLRLTGNGLSRSVSLRVEEYKRPTFMVEMDVPTPQACYGRDAWELGDSLTLRGTVKTYSGISVAEAKVCWSTERSVSFWRMAGTEDAKVTGETTSGPDGTFEIVVRLRGISDEDVEKGIAAPWLFYRFTTQCDVTAPNGESVTATATVVARQPVPEEWQKKEAERKEPWRIATSDDCSKARMVLTLPGAWAYYDVVTAQGEHVAEQTVQVTDSLVCTLDWQPAYGDAAVAYLGWMQDGTFHSISCRVERPRPDKRLLLSWSTFRNKLQPGQEETWSLTVRKPDGAPADALVMARLYDASLDAISKGEWTFDIYFPRYIHHPSMWRPGRTASLWLYYNEPVDSWGSWRLSHWRSSMFSFAGTHGMVSDMMRPMPVAGSMLQERTVRAKGSSKYAMADELMMTANMSAKMEDAAPAEEVAEEDASAGAEMADVPVREHFGETAFFMPALRTDAEGEVTMTFTLPESLTQWNFSAFAHDRQMNYGILHDTIVARKEIMAEVAAPRFLRDGDVADVPVTVRNVSSTRQCGTLAFLLSDADGGKPLRQERQTFALEAGASVTFHFTVKANLRAMGVPASSTDPTDGLAEALAQLAVKVVAQTEPDAEGQVFRDGEQRAIPLLSGRVVVETAVPFSFTEAGQQRVDLSSLGLKQLMRNDALCQPELSVEYTGNPLWSVVRTVPALLEMEALSANDAAVRLYIVEVARCLSEQIQEVRDEMPSSAVVGALRYAALDQLRDRQCSDGGFSWMPGFPSSFWVTADVGILLGRMKHLTGSTFADGVLERAMDYMEKEAAAAWEEMRKHPSGNGLSETLLRYLYVRTLCGLEPDAVASRLIERACQQKKSLTMYGKGVVAQVLAESAATGVLSRHLTAECLVAADESVQSLVEHTVLSPVMGRYFDTQRAQVGWGSYRIPTQTMTLEALANPHLGKEADNWMTQQDRPALQQEMRLWLLQSKRTQQWESTRATADATYALLLGYDAQASAFQHLGNEDHSVRMLTPDETAKALRTSGYNINKESEGLSWGCVRARYTLPAALVQQAGAELTVARRWQVWHEGRWADLPDSDGQQAKWLVPGVRVRQVFTVKAARDFDFVRLEAGRPANLEPVSPLSGTVWTSGNLAYRMVRDTRNDFYFEHFPKGTMEFAEEYFVARSGRYSTGLLHISCAFAPEFSGYAPAVSISSGRE